MRVASFLLSLIPVIPLLAEGNAADQGWIATSKDFTEILVNVEMRQNPESGSYQGLSEYDALVSQPTLAGCFHAIYRAKP